MKLLDRAMAHADLDAPPRALVAAAALQGGWFLATGLWPLVHMRSFEAITGPKYERWLVKMFGSVIAIMGSVLIDAARRRSIDRSLAMLALGSAAALAGVDVVYTAKGRISPVYLVEAAVELGLLGGWMLGLRQRRRARRMGW